MIRAGLAVFAGLVLLSVVAWNAGQDSVDLPRRQPTEAERIIAFCSETEHEKSPLCQVEAEDPDAVRDAVRDIVQQQPPSARVIEREREVIRENEDDDDESPRVEVRMPETTTPQQQQPTPTQTTPPSLLPGLSIPKIPEMPEINSPNLGLPLLP